MTSRPAALWNRWWEPRAPLERLAMVRILFAGYACLDVLVHRGWIAHADAPELFRHPYGPLGWLHAPRLDAVELNLLWLVAIAAGVLATIGWHARVALGVQAMAFGWWTLEHYSYGEPSHARTTLVTGLLALALSPCGEALSIKTGRSRRLVSGWAIEVIAVSLAYLYLTAGLAKLRFVGVDWWHAGATQTGIALMGPSWARDLSANHPDLINAFALVALLFELAAPVLLWRGRLRRVYASLAIAFHLGVLVTMGVDFLPMAAACLAMFPLERVLGQPARSAPRPRRSEPGVLAADERPGLAAAVPAGG